MEEKEKQPLNEEDQKLINERTYDSALATLVIRLGWFVVPLINELFGENFSEKARVRIRNGKHIMPQADGSLKRRDSDAFVELYE